MKKYKFKIKVMSNNNYISIFTMKLPETTIENYMSEVFKGEWWKISDFKRTNYINLKNVDMIEIISEK